MENRSEELKARAAQRGIPWQVWRDSRCGKPEHPKRRYTSERQAKDEAREVKKRFNGKRKDAYLCPWCGYWHVGSIHRENLMVYASHLISEDEEIAREIGKYDHDDAARAREQVSKTDIVDRLDFNREMLRLLQEECGVKQ